MSQIAEISQPDFLYTLCQVGAEPALKKELSRSHPELKFAYSRPGFVTFKSPGSLDLTNFRLQSTFARLYGKTLGQRKIATVDLELNLSQILAQIAALAGDERVDLHIYERDQVLPGDEPPGFDPVARSAQLKENVENLLQSPDSPLKPKQVRLNQIAPHGTRAIDLVVIDWSDTHVHLFLGERLIANHQSPYPGAHPRITLPKKAPSRAYIKMSEGLLWSQAPIKRGDRAIEIGSAPGGASLALLEKGLQVVGIDPGKVDQIVLDHPHFRFIQSSMAEVDRDLLPRGVHWLICDMNVTPNISLYAIDKLTSRYALCLVGVLLTIKLNQWKLADEIPAMLEHVKSMGMVEVHATQLPSNRQEFFIFGLTKVGQKRKEKGLTSQS